MAGGEEKANMEGWRRLERPSRPPRMSLVMKELPSEVLQKKSSKAGEVS